jgi:hypothetical protein
MILVTSPPCFLCGFPEGSHSSHVAASALDHEFSPASRCGECGFWIKSFTTHEPELCRELRRIETVIKDEEKNQ